MRIGTWNLEGRWSADHARAMAGARCDVWLLTAIRPRVSLEGYHQHLATALIAEGNHWAGLLSRWPIEPEPDPHPASALGRIDGHLYCASVLPWPLLHEDGVDLWEGEDHLSRVTSTIEALAPVLGGAEAVWGGAWNQPLAGNIVGYSRTVQEALGAAVDDLGMQVPTATLRARNGRQNTVDQVAVPKTWLLADAGAVTVDGALSDHDIYWVEASPIL